MKIPPKVINSAILILHIHYKGRKKQKEIESGKRKSIKYVPQKS